MAIPVSTKEKKWGKKEFSTMPITHTSWHASSLAKASLSWHLPRREGCTSHEISHNPQPSKPYLLQKTSASMRGCA
jgi:hypothetical protein